MPTVNEIKPEGAGDSGFADEKPIALVGAQDEEEDEEEDETIMERLYGLREMFPESLRNGTSSLVSTSWDLTQWLYSTGRTGAWVVFSSATILALPAMLEREMLEVSQMEKQQQQEMLLGPGASAMGANMGFAPQLTPMPAQ